MSSEKKYISFYDESHKKVLPKLLNGMKVLGVRKKEDIHFLIEKGENEFQEELIFEDAGIKFKMSQLLQILRGYGRLEDTVPEKTEIIYKIEDNYYDVELVFEEEVLGNIIYYEIRINDVFDILDNAGMELKDFMQKYIEKSDK